MADKIKIRRGDFVDLPNLDEAEFGLATDTGTLYIGTEEATNILINPVLEHGDGYSIDGYLIPAVDNVHNLGTPDNRWASVYVGPGTINIVAKDSDAGFSTNTEYRIGIDSASGTLQIVAGDNDLLMVLDPDTGVTFPAGGSVEADPGLTNTVTEHYNQQGQINQDIIKALDAYGGSATEDEHYIQQSQINQSILQSLDGYASVPNTNATGDGYLAFYTGVGRNLAGDNDLFWDRENGRLGIGTDLPNSTLDVRGIATFIGDTGVGGHSFIASGANTNNRRGILVEHRTSGVMTDGFGIRIQLSHRDSDGISNVVAELGTSRVGSDDSGDLLFLTASGGVLTEKLRIGASGNSTVSGDFTVAGSIINKDLTETFQVIRQATDGYASVPNTAAIGDGYIAFFIDGGRQIAGDNDLFYNRESGSLGVGIDVPTGKLHVTGPSGTAALVLDTPVGINGTALAMKQSGSASPTNTSLTFSPRADGTEHWVFGSDGTTFKNYMSFDYDGFLVKFGPGGSSGGLDTLVADLANGRVGISTAIPVARLEVEDNAMSSGMVVKITHDDHNVYGLVIGNDTFSTTDTDGMAMYVDNSGVSVLDARGTASRLSVQVGGTDRIRITNTGLVGLSTATPQNRLDVEGAAVIGATYAGTNTAPTNGLLIEGNVGIGITTVGSTQVDVTQSTSSTVVSGVDISNDSTGDAFIRFGLGASRGYSMGIDNSDSDALKIGTAANTASGVDTGTFMVMTTAGSVGVGGTPINGKFEVNTALDEAVVSTAYASIAGVNARGVLQARANGGGVILGMNNTTHSAYTRGGEAMNGAAEMVTFNAGDAVTKFIIGNVNASPIHFIINDTKAATISSNMNVGIGTQNPIERLTVNGSIALQELATSEVPVAQDGYGKIYVKTDDKLYYKDGLGAEGIITTSVDGADGYIAFYTSAGALAGDNDLFYDRVNSILSVTGGVSEVQVGDSDFKFDFQAGGEGVPGIVFDSGNDRIRYVRSSDSIFFDLGGATAFSISSTAASVTRTLRPGADDTYDLGSLGSLRWRNGYFSTSIIAEGGLVVGFSAVPTADEIRLGDATFKLDFDAGGAGVPGLVFDTNDDITYDRATNALDININNIGRLSINSDGYVQTLGDTPAEAATQIRISGSNDFTSGIEFYTTTTARRGFVGWRGISSGSGLADPGMYLVNFDNTPLFLGTSSTNRVQITATDGYVGVNGTPGPAGGVGPSRLQIFADAAGESMFSVRDGSNGVALEIISPATSQLFIRGGAGDNIHFGTNGSNDAAITIKSNNEVDLPGFVAYASVTNLTDSTANASEYNPFASGSHAAYVENTNWQHNTASNMVVFTPADGRFTVERTGVYAIEAVVLMTQSATGILDNFAVRLNGSTTIWVAQPFVHSSVDPVERSINFYYSLSAGDYLELLVNSSAATTLIVDNGTTFNMRRIA